MNLNKDYIAVVDVKNATVTVPDNMSFYITDIKTANIFAQLVINESKSELVKNYAPVENAEDFEITLRVIKPNNEFKEAKFTFLEQLESEAFFMVDLTDEYKDYVGTYKCELFVDCLVNGELERITTSSFKYKVNKSITNDLDEVIEGDPNYPLVEEILSKLEGIDTDGLATEEYVDKAIDNIEIPEVDLSDYATEEYVDNAIANIDANYDIDLSPYATIKYVDERIEDIELTPGPQGPQGEPGPAPDLAIYASIEYVDDKIGDIEAALSAILGGEDNE